MLFSGRNPIQDMKEVIPLAVVIIESALAELVTPVR
jgi:hypothetical protein